MSPFVDEIVGFSGERVQTRGYIDLYTTFGEGKVTKTISIRYLVLDANTSYNILLGRPSLNALGAIVSTPHLAMKFPSLTGDIVTIHVDQRTARECYIASLRMPNPRKLHSSNNIEKITYVDGTSIQELDPRMEDEERVKPLGGTEVLPLDNGRFLQIGATLCESEKSMLAAILVHNKISFAWTTADLPGIDPDMACHRLSTFKEAKPVAQRKRKLGEEKRKAAREESSKLLQAGFIREARYTTWLANVVIVKKPNGKWRMCTDYTDLNKACPKDAYPLPNIDRLVDGAAGHHILSFLDAFSGYHQIPMDPRDKLKTAFITEEANYYYEVMPFGLKNAGATYQRFMDQIFKGMIGRNLEVYVDDLVVKSNSIEQHVKDLAEVFTTLNNSNMRLNPEKCVFGVDGGRFLGFMLTNRGIEANPEKCEAISSMRSPKNLKEVQRLMGRLAALSRFMPKLAEKAKPILKLLKKATRFHWDEACEQSFESIKQFLTSPPILQRPDISLPLVVYLAATEDAVSAAIVQEKERKQQPVYFVSRTLQDAETRYQTVEKMALSLLMTARRLRPYFQNHRIIVRTDHPVHKILRKPDLAGRMAAWAIELSEYEIHYEPRGPIKAQSLADFATELQDVNIQNVWWTLHVDGSSNIRGGGAGIVLEGPNDIVLEQSLRFKFRVSNNQAEYEAMVAGLALAKEMGVARIVCHTDSKLTVGHLTGEFQVKDPLLLQYYHIVRNMLQGFEEHKVEHVPRACNVRADILSKLASTKSKGKYKAILQKEVIAPSTNIPECHEVEISSDWRTPIVRFLRTGNKPEPLEKDWERKIARYTLVGDELFRRGFTSPLLKCIDMEQAEYVMRELHQGIYGYHSGARTMSARILRAGYYWPTMVADVSKFVKRCIPCKKHGNISHVKQEEIHNISSPWPFAKWGMDIVDPFTPGKGQVKFLLVAVDYFTKWVEAEPLATITAQQVQKFVWKSIVCRFGIPHTIITDNGNQFTDTGLKEFYQGLHIKHVTSSVEHPQGNGQAEAANKVILQELKKRLDQAKGLWPEQLLEVL